MEFCLDCGSKLNGRLDKKFCDDHCRSHYNNELNRGRNAALKEINRILRTNACILEKLTAQGINLISHNMLRTTGFNFNFYTHQEGYNGNVYFCCYNYGYHYLNDDELLLVAMPVLSK